MNCVISRVKIVLINDQVGDTGRPVFSRGKKKGDDIYENGHAAGTTSST